MEAEVYKLSTGLWTTVYSKAINCKVDINHTSVYLNGAIHWVSQSKNEDGEITNSLLVFDLIYETISEMGLPRVVMNQYGKLESWVEKFVLDLNGGISDAIGFTRNENFLVVQYPGSLLSYDTESREFKDLDIHGRSEFFFLSKYDESLVLLDGSCGATADTSIASESEKATELQPELGQTSRD
ncbi:hypothetical protein HAX54_018187 [Datura stramonium]|uniref:F-box associated beta-propeller type 1 domain-containing protein n=1 Tax=Datura stramonium TaxID=4076 RepID=A0ABS8ULY3_DATST|nr:hypothetical protein [Datura stramonium]